MKFNNVGYFVNTIQHFGECSWNDMPGNITVQNNGYSDYLFNRGWLKNISNYKIYPSEL